VTFGTRRAMRALTAMALVAGSAVAATAQQPTSEQISAIRASCRSDFMAQCAGVKPGTREALECLKHDAAKVSPACKTALDAVGPPPTESAAPAPTKSTPSAPAAATTPPPAPAESAEPPAAAAEQAMPPPQPGGEGGKHPSQAAAIRSACRSDFGVHCPGVKRGSSAGLRCLQANAAALSPPCREAVMAMGEGAAPPPAASGAAPPAVAPLGPIAPMRPRQALAVLSLCGAERQMLCGNVPPGGGRIIECLAENYARLSPECYGALARAAR
jgi:hypothetical protein